MNFIYFLRELWHRRLAVVVAAIGAAVLATLVVYNVSVSPPGLSKRDHVEARGSIEILVDSAKSPIADVGRNLEPLTARAGVFARYIAGGNVIARIAEETGIPAKQIEVAGPAPLPGEAVGVTAPPAKLLPYGIEIVQRDALPIVNVETRAPTVAQARELAAAAPGAIRGIVTGLQEQQQIPVSKRVTFRVLGPAQADLATEALGLKAAVGIFIVLFAFGILLILGLPRLIAAWRSVDAEPPVQEHFGFPAFLQSYQEIRPHPLPSLRRRRSPSVRSWKCAAAAMANEQEVSRSELREATLEGVRWISATRLAFEIVAVAGAIVLAHLVPPAEYGRFAIALVVPEIALSLVNEGLGTPLVRHKALTERHAEGTMAIGVAGGLLLTALTYFVAPLIATPLFGAGTSELIQLYSPVFTIAGVMIVPLAMLQRRLEFNRIGLSEVVSAAVTTIVSIALALAGLDAEAFVLGSIAGIFAWAAVLLIFAGSTPLPIWRGAEAREIAATGAPAAGAGLAGIGSRNVDYAILGARLTPSAVGFYYRAFTLGVEYERKVSGIVSRIAFPVYSRTKDMVHLRSVRQRIVRLNATLIFPLMVFFIVVAPVLVPWLFGARWEPAVVLAQILAVAGMAGTLKNTIDPLVLAAGRPRSLMVFNVCEVVLYAAMLFLVSAGGDLVLVCAAVASFRVVTLISSYAFLLGPVLDSTLVELLDDAGPALLACLALVAAALPLRLFLDAPVVPLLAACAVAGFTAYALVLRLISPASWIDIRLIASRLIPWLDAEKPRPAINVGVPAAAVE